MPNVPTNVHNCSISRTIEALKAGESGKYRQDNSYVANFYHNDFLLKVLSTTQWNS